MDKVNQNIDQYIPTFTDTTTWDRNVYANTGGTRSKTILIHPDTDDQYFFKGSKELDNGEFRYPTEFWSEIVSSKIGQLFDFDMLDYNIAFNAHSKQKIGCLSKSMINNSINKLTEGKEFLMGFDGQYDPEQDKKDYTFQFIKNSLKKFELHDYLDNIIDIIVFDALIGNSDRHQENWAIISNFEKVIKSFEEGFNRKGSIFLRRFMNNIFIWVIRQHERYIGNADVPKSLNRYLLKNRSEMAPHYFSTIYDSGCCLGREILDEKVKLYLSEPQRIKKYVEKGTSEIHWEGNPKKKNHFELIKLIREEFPKEVNSAIEKVKKNIDKKRIVDLIQQIDCNLPEKLKEHKLTTERKELMIKLITLRAEKLIEL